MRKIRHQKSEKNERQNLTKNNTKNQSKNDSKFHLKNTRNSRTMEWLKIPSKIQKEFRKNHISTAVDYLQYTCYDISDPLIKIIEILGLSYDLDTDNSNISFNKNKNLSLTKKDTDKWEAYSVQFLTPGFAPISIMSVEIYNQDKVKLLKTEGKIVFYGAYFVFKEIIEEEAPEIITFQKSIEFQEILKPTMENKKIYKRTRVDIATDIKIPISKKWLTKYIQPHKNSKHAIRHYNYDQETEIFQSLAYIPKLSQGLGLRVYNKILDIEKKNKQGWYPNYWPSKENEIVTRMEIVFWWDACQDRIENLIRFARFRLLWTEEVRIARTQRPKSEYSPYSAFEYFKRYAKNHWKSLKEVLDDVMLLAIEEEMKDMEN